MPKQECREAGGRDRIEIVKIASCRAQNQNPFSPWLVHHDEALMLSTRGGMPDLYVFERAGNPEIRFEPKTFKGFFKLNQRQGSTGASFSFCCWRELLSANAVRLWALPLKDNDLNLQNVTYLPSPCEAARANVRKPSSGPFFEPGIFCTVGWSRHAGWDPLCFPGPQGCHKGATGCTPVVS